MLVNPTLIAPQLPSPTDGIEATSGDMAPTCCLLITDVLAYRPNSTTRPQCAAPQPWQSSKRIPKDVTRFREGRIKCSRLNTPHRNAAGVASPRRPSSLCCVNSRSALAVGRHQTVVTGPVR